MKKAFGDVHMLSHVVGASNRADIRRLAALEHENAALRAKVERQQARLHEAITSRDATIRRLSALSAQQVRALPAETDCQTVEALRAQWIKAETFGERRQLAAAIQRRAFETVPYIPTGQWTQMTAYHRNLKGVISAPSFLMWNIEKV